MTQKRENEYRRMRGRRTREDEGKRKTRNYKKMKKEENWDINEH